MQKRVILAVVVIVLMFAMIAAYVLFSYNRIKPDENRICEGITVDSVDIGGMTEEEAVLAVQSHLENKGNQQLEVDVNGQIVTAAVNELGYQYTAGDFAGEAMKVGRSGSILENYKQIKEAKNGKIKFKTSMNFDEKALKRFVRKRCKTLCTKAKNAGIKMEDGKLVYTKSREGVSLDVAETAQLIRQAVEASADGGVIHVKADVKVDQPKVTEETAARCKDKIGTFSTVFNAGNVNRSKNLANAARLISGSVVMPGETFSVHDAISPLTEENGYYEAASYNNGKVEDSLGGGVCQVSTTLYNAVLRAELEIVARSPHSMVVSYVKPSMDAAIAGDYKDFKFKNDTDVPIYIQGGTYSGNIYFNIYGEETRSPDRKVTFESEVTDTIQPGADKVTYDKTKPESYMTVTQEAHTGYKAILWKIVSENGKETKTQVNSSTYSASPRYVTRGAAKEPAKTPKPQATKKPSSHKQDDKKDDGDTSPSGRSGNNGTQGSNGTQGTNGTQGSSGTQDSNGTQDANAAQNANGAQASEQQTQSAANGNQDMPQEAKGG